MMRTWVRGFTKLRLRHINDPSPHRGFYIFLGTSELSLPPKFPSSRVHVGLDLPHFPWPRTTLFTYSCDSIYSPVWNLSASDKANNASQHPW